MENKTKTEGAKMTMHEKIKKLSAPLNPADIELRSARAGKSQSGVWASLLCYKTSRIDVARMNDVLGANWSVDYDHDKAGLLFARVGVYNDELNQWVFRVDVGAESNTSANKGLYSDALKRACFRWGIGCELYSMPQIFVNLYAGDYTERNGKIQPKLAGWRIEYRGANLVVVDKKNVVRFSEKWSFLETAGVSTPAYDPTKQPAVVPFPQQQQPAKNNVGNEYGAGHTNPTYGRNAPTGDVPVPRGQDDIGEPIQRIF